MIIRNAIGAITLIFIATIFAPLNAGFAAGTYVKTPIGYTSIENLKIGDLVVAYDTRSKIVEHSHVLAIKKAVVINTLILNKSESQIVTTRNQRMYDYQRSCWHSVTQSLDGFAISENTDPTEVYEITIETFHNFYITTDDILVHNAAFLVPIIAPSLITSFINGVSIAAVAASVLFFGNKINNTFKPKNFPHENGNPNSDDPDKDKNRNPKPPIKISEKDAQHIFRKKEGHLPDTPANRQLLIDTASDLSNFLGLDKYGNAWFSKILSNGKQIWAAVRGGYVRYGGMNEASRTFNFERGLCQTPKGITT